MTTSAEPVGKELRPPQVAADLMDPQPPTVGPETSVGEVARLLVEQHLSGVPVVAPSGEFIGLVTQSDLVSRHAHVHFPFYLTLLGGAIPLGERRFREEMRRITGRTAAELMSENPYTAREDTPLEDIASRMAKDGVDPVVVLRGDKLAGLITREQLVRLVVTEETTTGGS
jgi:CBS domain-containing protein